MDKKNILVTGGAGALGSYIVKRYLDEGHRVICVDNLMKTQTVDNIKSHFGNKRFRFIQQDIIEPLHLSGEKIDWIFNAACPVSCVSLQVDPVHTVKSCVLGVIHLLDIARRDQAVFLQCSSADIYGEMKGLPFKESDLGTTNTLSARACYEEGKRIAETLCMDYHRKYGVSVKIARIFNTAGPHTQMTDGRIPSIFIYNALAQRPIRIYGTGVQTRCFLHVEDQVEGLHRLMATPPSVTGPVNIGSEEEITVLELAKKIIEKTKSTSTIEFEHLDEAPLFRRPDTSLAKQLLDWKPTRSLDQMLDDMIAHYQKIGLPEKTVLAFAARPTVGGAPAEDRFLRLAEAMPETTFHILTPRATRAKLSVEQQKNVILYRLGFGSSIDELLFPLFAFGKALALNKQHRYRFIWSSLTGSASFLGLIAARAQRRSLLVMRHEEEATSSFRKRWNDFVLTHADAVYGSDDQKEVGRLVERIRKTYADLTAKQEGKLSRPV